LRVLQVLHSVLVSTSDVIIVVGGATSEPLLEGPCRPLFVSPSDDSLSLFDGGHDPSSLGGTAVGVGKDRLASKSSVIEPDVLHASSVLEVLLGLSGGCGVGRSDGDGCEDSARHEF